MLNAISASLDDSKAQDIVAIPLSGRTSIADYMVVASGQSQRHVVSTAEKLLQALKSLGLSGVTAEGLALGEWVLIDAGDVIVHVLKPETRDFYALERLWSSADDVANAKRRTSSAVAT